MRRWRRGETALFRYVGHDDGITWGWPQVVVEDTDDHVLLFIPEGAVIERYDIEEERFVEPFVQRLDMLRLAFFGRGHSVCLYFDAGGGVPPWYEPYFGGVEGRFKGWKVDLAAPLRRTPQGFDATDNVLDIVVRPDLRWSWKDEAGLDRRVALGTFTSEQAASFREEGRSAAAAVERREWPFVPGWEEWRPDAAWPVPSAPPGWQRLPGRDIDLNRDDLYRSLRKRGMRL